jgi:hypothetical protein
MGIDVSHSLLVGASYEELEEFFEKIIELGETEQHGACGNTYEVVECYFDYASPYYDSDVEDQFFGFRVQNYADPNEVWFDEVKKACERFEELTGVKARIRGGAHVW